MDVSATAQAAASAAAQTSVVTGTVPSDQHIAAPAQPAGAGTGAQSTTAAGTPDTAAQTAPQSGSNQGGIAPAIAKLFGNANPPEPIRLDVSYRVLRDPDQIVTVFSDPRTGQEVAQFPPDILVGIATFFDQQSGVTLDRNA